MSTDQPTMKELCAKAVTNLVPHEESRGGYYEPHECAYARRQLAVRCSPEVMLRVVEALEHSANLFEHLKNHSWGDKEQQPHIEQMGECRAVLRLLNGGAT